MRRLEIKHMIWSQSDPWRPFPGFIRILVMPSVCISFDTPDSPKHGFDPPPL